MSVDFSVIAESREDQGKGASRRLRRQGLIPGIVYGGKSGPVSITVRHNEMARHLEDEAFYSHILEMQIDGKPERVILKDLQRHPSKPLILHADFMRIVAGQKIRVNVPLHVVGEDNCPGTKAGGLVGLQMNDVEIDVLPRNLPEYIEVDVSGLELGAVVHLTDLVMPEGAVLVALSHGDDHDHDQSVLKIAAPKVVVEEDESVDIEDTSEGAEDDDTETPDAGDE